MKFQPTRSDGRSFRDVAVKAFEGRLPEEILTYEELGSVLSVDEKPKIQKAVREANKVLLKLHHRGVKVVPKVGYRVLPAREHVVVASDHRTKADKALGRALDFFEGANLSEMTPNERKLHDGTYMVMQALVASHRHLDQRLKQVEDLLRGTKTVEG